MPIFSRLRRATQGKSVILEAPQAKFLPFYLIKRAGIVQKEGIFAVLALKIHKSEPQNGPNLGSGRFWESGSNEQGGGVSCQSWDWYSNPWESWKECISPIVTNIWEFIPSFTICMQARMVCKILQANPKPIHNSQKIQCGTWPYLTANAKGISVPVTSRFTSFLYGFGFSSGSIPRSDQGVWNEEKWKGRRERIGNEWKLHSTVLTLHWNWRKTMPLKGKWGT